jgi:Na+-translocating ferredoxin:NAD+ oxidoreductase RnfD subunit
MRFLDLHRFKLRSFTEITYPKLNDVRWTILAFHLSYVYFSTHSNAFNRTGAQFFAAAGTCIILDGILLYLKNVPLVPLSGFISSMGITLFCDSPHVWPYAVVATLSILSKHFIRIRGWHVFNPNNFGIVVSLLYLNRYMTVTAGRWGGFTVGTVIVASLGTLLAYRARKIPLAAAYFCTFNVGVVIRAFITERPVLTVGAPLTGAAFQLFLFYMITDPQTTPRSLRGQIAFGFTVAALDSLLRHIHYKYAPFLALFITSALYSFWKAVTGEINERPWSVGTFKLKPAA